jgi:hypothetical protein
VEAIEIRGDELGKKVVTAIYLFKGAAMARISDIHTGWLKERKYKKAYVALEEEFVLAAAVIDVGIVRALHEKKGPARWARRSPWLPGCKADAGASGARHRPRLLIGIEPREAKRP